MLNITWYLSFINPRSSLPRPHQNSWVIKNNFFVLVSFISMEDDPINGRDSVNNVRFRETQLLSSIERNIFIRKPHHSHIWIQCWLKFTKETIAFNGTLLHLMQNNVNGVAGKGVRWMNRDTSNLLCYLHFVNETQVWNFVSSMQ
jgi:hypothetical protein